MFTIHHQDVPKAVQQLNIPGRFQNALLLKHLPVLMEQMRNDDVDADADDYDRVYNDDSNDDDYYYYDNDDDDSGSDNDDDYDYCDYGYDDYGDCVVQ